MTGKEGVFALCVDSYVTNGTIKCLGGEGGKGGGRGVRKRGGGRGKGEEPVEKNR